MDSPESMSRLSLQLEVAFKLLNNELFDNKLETPVISVSPMPKSYGRYIPCKIWNVKNEGKREIIISSETLDRPLYDVIATLIHEMVHMYCDTVDHIKDTSNCGIYHNKRFKKIAEEHGLVVSRGEKYGYSITNLSDDLISFVDKHQEFSDIDMYRDGGLFINIADNNHHRKYQCPKCGNSVRATKIVNVMCMDCDTQMQIHSF